MNRNAFIGRNVEILFKNSIGDNPSVIKKIQAAFGITANYLNAMSTGIHSEKADVKMEFADGHNIDANIKAFKRTSASYNQLTRTSIAHFSKLFFDDAMQAELEKRFVAKAAHLGQSFSAEMLPQFEAKAKDILHWAFSFKESREILVIYEREDSVMSLYAMKDVIKLIGKQVSMTKNGNIAIGNSVIIQRKGGNGVHSIHIKKTDLKHPGNNVQVKLKMRDFQVEMKTALLAQYHI